MENGSPPLAPPKQTVEKSATFSLRRRFRYDLHERPVFPPLSSVEIYAVAANFTLRLLEAKVANSQVGVPRRLAEVPKLRRLRLNLNVRSFRTASNTTHLRRMTSFRRFFQLELARNQKGSHSESPWVVMRVCIIVVYRPTWAHMQRRPPCNRGKPRYPLLVPVLREIPVSARYTWWKRCFLVSQFELACICVQTTPPNGGYSRKWLVAAQSLFAKDRSSNVQSACGG